MDNKGGCFGLFLRGVAGRRRPCVGRGLLPCGRKRSCLMPRLPASPHHPCVHLQPHPCTHPPSHTLTPHPCISHPTPSHPHPHKSSHSIHPKHNPTPPPTHPPAQRWRPAAAAAVRLAGGGSEHTPQTAPAPAAWPWGGRQRGRSGGNRKVCGEGSAREYGPRFMDQLGMWGVQAGASGAVPARRYRRAALQYLVDGLLHRVAVRLGAARGAPQRVLGEARVVLQRYHSIKRLYRPRSKQGDSTHLCAAAPSGKKGCNTQPGRATRGRALPKPWAGAYGGQRALGWSGRSGHSRHSARAARSTPSHTRAAAPTQITRTYQFNPPSPTNTQHKKKE
jgi:hypothetical protein